MTFAEQITYLWNVRERFIESLGLSLLIAFFALLIGFIIGVIMAMIKIAPKNNFIVKILDKFVDIYVAVIRGTPMLVQLLIMYSVILASLKTASTNLIVPIVSFGINSGAYMAEIIRSGINSVDKGQMEAGRSLGLNWVATMIKIIIPQAIKVVVPTIFNEIIILVKETSIIGSIVINVNQIQKYDLLTLAEVIAYGKAGVYMMSLFVVALFYLIVVFILTLIQKAIERRLSKNER